jgi:hypothetical protein
MPTLVWRYLTAWLSDRPLTSGVDLAEALETVSHDRLARLLPAEWSGQTLLDLAVRTLCVRERGYLILRNIVASTVNLYEPIGVTPTGRSAEGLGAHAPCMVSLAHHR